MTLVGDAAPRKVTEEMSIEEAGNFAGPSYLTARQQHLSNRDAYRALASMPVPATVPDARSALKALVHGALESEPADRAALAKPGLPANVRDQLVEHLAVVFMVASGLEQSEYLASLPAGSKVVVDPDSGPLRFVRDQFGVGSDADPKELFSGLYELNRGFREGANNASRWASANDGFRLAVDWVKAGDDLDLIYRELDSLPDASEADRVYAFWFGMLAQGAIVCHQPPTPFEAAAGDRAILLAHANLIMQSADDAFPVEVKCWFDSESQRWWTLAVARRSAIRLANGPPLIY